MKLSKLEAYRVFSMHAMLWPLTIRFNGDNEKIAAVLDTSWANYYSHLTKCPAGTRLEAMKKVIAECPLLHKYLPQQ